MKDLLKPGGRLSMAVLAVLALVLFARGVTEEVRTGHFAGRAQMAESGLPLANATIVLRSKLDDEGEGRLVTRVAKTDKDGTFSFRHLPVGASEVSAYTRAHTLESASVVIQQGQTTYADLDLKPNLPYLDVYSPQKVFLPNEEARLHCRGFAPESKMQVGIYRPKQASIASKGGLRNLLDPYRYYYEKIPNLQNASEFDLVRTQDWSLKNRDSEGIFDEQVTLPRMDPGLYVIQLDCGSARKFTWLAISEIALVTKTVAGEVLAYVARLDTGTPVSQAEVGLVGDQGLKLLAKTNREGIARFKIGSTSQSGSYPVYAMSGTSIAMTSVSSYGDSDTSSIRMSTNTDRPVYRPGDVVRFKTIVRDLVGPDYAMPSSGTLNVRLEDPDGNLVQTIDCALSDFGTGDGVLRLPAGMTGQFAIVCQFAGAKSTRWVPVMSYRKPEFKITVKPEQTTYLRGQKVRFKANCAYYFGGPVPGAEVRASIYRRPLYRPFSLDDDVYPEWGDDTGSYLGEYVGSVPTRTNAQGVAEIEFDPARQYFGDDGPNRSQPFDFGTSDFEFVCEVWVTEAGDKYFSGRGSVAVVRGDYDLRAEAEQYLVGVGDKPTTTISLKRYDDGKPVAGAAVVIEYGINEWRGAKTVFVRLGADAVQTDANGKAEVKVEAVKPGELVVKASVRDTRGNRIEAESYIYVLSAGATPWGGPTPKLDLILDKPTYKVGESVQGMIRTDKVGGTALVTVEGERVYESYAVPLKTPATSFSFKLSRQMTPNSFVAVAYVREKTFSEAQRMLRTDMAFRTIDVKVSPDKEIAQPGDAITYDIQTTDPSGAPVSAECSLGVVDESVYAIAEDRYDPVSDFYPRRYQSVNTDYSFPEHFLDGGDKGPVSGEVRQNFQDTAAWIPRIVTDSTGKASVTIRLPDNVTEWRATVRAVTSSTAFGKGTAFSKARLPLMVRLSAPSHVVEGDRIRVSATVLQDVADTAEVQVVLKSTVGDLGGGATQVVRAQRNTPATLRWDWSPKEVGTAKLTVSAEGAGHRDAMSLDIPVETHGRLQVHYASGEITRDEERLTLSRIGNATDGYVKVTVTPTLVSALLDSLDGLIDYPYGCTEQTMSRFLPAVVAGRVIQSLGIQRPDLQKKLPEVVEKSLSRLRTLQKPNGTWGWWENDEPDPGMTALVLEGLWESERSGYPAPQSMVSRALSGAKVLLEQPSGTHAPRAHLAYALSLWESGPALASIVTKVLDPKIDDPQTLAYLALTYTQLGRSIPEWRTRAEDTIRRLKQMARRQGGGMFWQEDYGNETTAAAMKTIAAFNPSDSDLLAIVRHLMRSKRVGGWVSTRDTAMILVLLAGRAEREIASRYSLSVELNGKSLGVVNVEPGSHLPTSFEVPISDLQSGTNELVLTKRGEGICYYAVETRQTPRQDKIGALVNKSGLAISQSFHPLQVVRGEDGSMRLQSSIAPQNQFKSGASLRCRLTIEASENLEYVLIEVPIPAGFRVTEEADPYDWNWWWSGITILDNRVAVFARTLTKGQHQIEINMRAETPGQVSALPAVCYEMYAPERRASCAETALKVTP